MRRVLLQANAAVKTKGTIFEIVYRPTLPASGTQTNYRGGCSSTLSADWVDPARGTFVSSAHSAEATECKASERWRNAERLPGAGKGTQTGEDPIGAAQVGRTLASAVEDQQWMLASTDSATTERHPLGLTGRATVTTKGTNRMGKSCGPAMGSAPQEPPHSEPLWQFAMDASGNSTTSMPPNFIALPPSVSA
jgi:hypothetical protein